MKVKATELRKMFVALGIDTASGWKLPKLTQKAGEDITKYKEGDDDLADAAAQNLYDDIVACKKSGEAVEIEDDLPAEEGKRPAARPKPESGEEPAAKPARKPRAASATGTPRQAPAWGDLKEVWKKKPQQLTDRGPGKIRTIVETLKEAGETDPPRPVTKEQVHAVLVKKFPDDDKDAMMTTVNNQIPSRLLLVRHIHVWKGLTKDGKLGYYIVGDGDKPQPKADIPKRPGPKPAATKATTAAKPAATKATTAKATTAKPAAKPAAKKATTAKPAAKKPAAKPAAKKKGGTAKKPAAAAE